jgi:hypothetical protein
LSVQPSKRATGIPWVADLRDSMVAHPHRHAERMLVRAKEQGEHAVTRLVARNASAIVTVSDAITDEVRERDPRGRSRRSRTARLRRLRRPRHSPPVNGSGSRTPDRSSGSAIRGRS